MLPETDIRWLGADLFARPYTADRTDVRRGEGFLRFGEPLIDRFAQFAEEDDRGRAFAVELAQKLDPNRRAELAFCFDYVISPDLSQASEAADCDSAFGRAVRARTAKFLPATLERVWWLSGRSEYPAQSIQYLERQQGQNLGSRPERFRQLMSEFDWPSCCDEAQQSAIEAMINRESVAQRIARARDNAKSAAERDLGILTVRSESAGIEIEKRVFDAVADALDHPTVRLESCGAVFITWDQSA
jgi:ATP-dependent helicase HepA